MNFTTEDIGSAWKKYLPVACTAEEAALKNLQKGVKPPETAYLNNPWTQWIGAYIRSDPWGYIAWGNPELAAEYAYRDACLSHSMNGLYGALFFSALIAAAFATENIELAIKAALAEIPGNCDFSKAIHRTIKWVPEDQHWEVTMDRILESFKKLNRVHTINNAAITIAGLLYGEGDFECTITLTVMGGLDTDCNAATAGSIVGAMKGMRNMPNKWVAPVRKNVRTYLNINRPIFSWNDLAKRFTDAAVKAKKHHC